MKTIRLIFAGLFIYLIFISCKSWQVPSSLIGTWQAKQRLSVRNKVNGKFVFIHAPDSVLLKFTIDDKGNVTGQLGNATFSNCKIMKNRGELGRKLNLATDYVIRGELNGYIFEGDPHLHKEINAPFDVKENKMTGSLFQVFGLGLYPMTGMDGIKTEN